PCIPPLFVSMTPRPPSSPLFPYTTLFRSEERKFDIIVSNPPYVSQSEYEQLPRDVRDYEPQTALLAGTTGAEIVERLIGQAAERDRKSTRLNSSHVKISYAVFCLKKKTKC